MGLWVGGWLGERPRYEDEMEGANVQMVVAHAGVVLPCVLFFLAFAVSTNAATSSAAEPQKAAKNLARYPLSRGHEASCWPVGIGCPHRVTYSILL